MNDSDPGEPLRHLLGVERRTTSERYYFDVYDGDIFYQDDNGIDVASADQIPSEAYDALKHIVYDKWPEGQKTMTVRVRDGGGKVVYEGTMTVNGRRAPP